MNIDGYVGNFFRPKNSKTEGTVMVSILHTFFTLDSRYLLLTSNNVNVKAQKRCFLLKATNIFIVFPKGV